VRVWKHTDRAAKVILAQKRNIIMISPSKYKKVLLIYTGGTIGMGRNPSTGVLEPLDFNHLVSRMPEFAYLKTEIDTYQFSRPVDSSDMSPSQWVQLVNIIMDRYEVYDGFVILHGTDTMAYTASALSFMMENLTKPVILTGSQLPIGQLRTDGKENLITSIELASMTDERGRAVVPEVCIYFSGKLLRGNRSTKQNADGFSAFESFNYPHLCDAGVEFTFHRHHIMAPDFSRGVSTHTHIDPNVVVFSLFPGIQENIVRHVLETPDIRGIVMRSYGSGNAPQKAWLQHLIRNATERGVTIVNISQCLSGRVEMDRYGTGYQLKDAGVISGYDSTVESAVTKLMLIQGKYYDRHLIEKRMNQSLCGEITV